MSLAPAMCEELLGRFRAHQIEAVVLSTCHRTELYYRAHAAEDDDARAEALWSEPLGGVDMDPVRLEGRVAGEHLFRVAAGLESLVLGETEVLGQIRSALDAAQRTGSAQQFLSRVFQAALRFGGRARSETGIGAGALSIASAAVRLLNADGRDLRALTVLVLGTGATGLKAARHLKAEGVGRLVLLNRTAERARLAAEELNAEFATLSQLPGLLAEADAVVAAAHVERPLVTRAMLGKRRRGPLSLVDLSLPRAIDPACAEHPGVELRNLSDLEQFVAANRTRRETEIPRVEALLARELDQLALWAGEHSVRALVAELRGRAENVRREEIARALADGGADPGTIDRLTRRLVDRLLHGPVRALREGASGRNEPHVDCLRRAFGIEAEPAPK
jgi:glutamyl-tRNA reductase